MTKLKRKTGSAPAAPTSWPSNTIKGRITDDGRVPGHAGGPTSALLEEALGRFNAVEDGNLDYDEHNLTAAEVKGLVVALSVLTCKTVDELYAQLAALRAARHGA